MVQLISIGKLVFVGHLRMLLWNCEVSVPALCRRTVVARNGYVDADEAQS